MFNRRKHQEFFAHLFDEGDPLDAQLQKKILTSRYFDKLPDDDRGEEKDDDIDDIMGMIHGEAVSWFSEEKIEGEQADDRREERRPGAEKEGAGNRCNQIDINKGHGINKFLKEKVQQGDGDNHESGEEVVVWD